VARGLQEEAAGHPLADQPALHVGEGGDHGVDLPLATPSSSSSRSSTARHDPVPSRLLRAAEAGQGCPKRPARPAGNPDPNHSTAEPAWRFVVGKLAIILLRPSNLLLLLAWAGLAGLWRRPRAWAKGLLALSLGLALTATLLPVGNWLMRPLEDRFPRPVGYPDRSRAWWCSAGGTDVDVTAGRGVPSFTDPGERYMALLELARHYPPAVPGPVHRRHRPARGRRAARDGDGALLLARHGLEGRVLLEDKARTTRENALYARDLADPKPGARWLLVTSAGHMPRSVGVFRAVGWEVTPWPVDYRTRGGSELGLKLRVADRLYELDEAAYEWLGLAYYRAVGWTAELFPGPRAPSTPQGVVRVGRLGPRRRPGAAGDQTKMNAMPSAATASRRSRTCPRAPCWRGTGRQGHERRDDARNPGSHVPCIPRGGSG
jgi:uncharacterized SAM-binding protein YcdF (DUF218 family)